MSEYIDDPDFSGSRGRIIDHYRQARRVYGDLAVCGSCITTGFIGNHNWYVYDGDHRRAKTFAADFDTILDDASPRERAMYVVASWKEPTAVYDGCDRPADGFSTGDGLGGYGSIGALPVWIDGDLEDKTRRGEFTDTERSAIETDIGHILDVVAGMYDLEPDDIAVFDSGGGVYPWGPAAATIPIAEEFEGEGDPILLSDSERSSAVGYIFDEMTDRINDYLDEHVDCEFIDTDAGLNNNRQSKAPLSIHSDHDIVVTPARDAAGAIDYTPTLVSHVDDDLIERTRTEAQKVVADTEENRACVDPLVKTLWPEYDGEWTTRLARWLLDERKAALDAIHGQARAEKNHRERVRNAKGGDSGSNPGVRTGLTPSLSDVYTALNRLDFERVAEATIVDDWTEQAAGFDDNSASGNRAFIPTWATASDISSGNANIITDKGWQDTGGGGYGGPVVMALVADGKMSPRTASPKRATDDIWSDGVELLRDHGFTIPRWIPEQGSDSSHGAYSQTPEWAIREVAYLHGHDRDGDLWRDVTTGRAVADTQADAEEYTDVTGIDTQRSVPALAFNAVLNILDDGGIDHNRTEREPARDVIR